MPFQSALVTGGAGFIGSHIVATLVSKGVRVAVVDDLSTGHKRNLESLLPAITFYEGDIHHSLATIAKAREALAFNPQTSLTDGLKVTYHWYQAQRRSHQSHRNGTHDF